MKTGVKVIIVLAIAIIVAFAAVTAIKRAKQRAARVPVAKIYPVVVKSYTPKISKVKLTLPAITIVQNDKNVALSPIIPARILSVKLSGQRVHKGEVVARLDITSIKSKIASLNQSLDASYVALKNLKATHKRTAELLHVKGASIEQFDKEVTSIAALDSKITSLKEQKALLENNLTYAVIKSPVNGVVSHVYFNKGAVGMPGHPVLAISADSGFYLLLRVPGDVPVKGVVFKGKTYPAVPLSATYNGLSEYKIYIPQKNLVTGDKVQASVVVFDGKGVFLPFDTILNNNKENYVLVIHKNQADIHKIKIIQDAQEGVVALNVPIGKPIVAAKPDVLLKLTSGFALRIKE